MLERVNGSPTPSPASRTPLATLSGNHMQFLQSCGPSVPAQVKDRFSLLVSALDTANATNTVLEEENKGLREAVDARKRKRAGVTVGNLGTHVFSTSECLERVMAREAAVMVRKRKGKDRAVSDGEEEPIDDIQGGFDGTRVELGDLERFEDEI